jgi:hypothetical protein
VGTWRYIESKGQIADSRGEDEEMSDLLNEVWERELYDAAMAKPIFSSSLKDNEKREEEYIRKVRKTTKVVLRKMEVYDVKTGGIVAFWFEDKTGEKWRKESDCEEY